MKTCAAVSLILACFGLLLVPLGAQVSADRPVLDTTLIANPETVMSPKALSQERRQKIEGRIKTLTSFQEQTAILIKEMDVQIQAEQREEELEKLRDKRQALKLRATSINNLLVYMRELISSPAQNQLPAPTRP